LFSSPLDVECLRFGLRGFVLILPNWMLDVSVFFVYSSSFLSEGRSHAFMYMMNEIHTIQFV
jgi:hypothetical protein